MLPDFYTIRKCSQCGFTDEFISKNGCPEKCGRTAAETTVVKEQIADLKRQLEEKDRVIDFWKSWAREAGENAEQERAHADALAHGLEELLYVYKQLISHGVIETPVATLRYTAKKNAENVLKAYRNREE